jgi:UDP-N-acetylglucosamine acyltransferase
MSNKIHPTALVGPMVDLGDNNIIGPGVVIAGPCKIGDHNWFAPHVVIGTPGQYQGGDHPVSWESGHSGEILIGSRNVFREFVTVHVSNETITSIGDECYFMTHSHIPHDARIETGVKLANSVHLGGYVHVGAHAYIGLGAMIHQRIFIGPGSMVGMGSIVTKHVPPLAKVFGSPARLRGVNFAKIKTFDLSENDAALFDQFYRLEELPNQVGLSHGAIELIHQFRHEIAQTN